MDSPALSFLSGEREKAILLVVLLATILIFKRKWSTKKFQLPLPPGPKKLPLLGNILDMPKKFEWLAFASWGKEFNSDIIHLSVAGSDFIVLNSVKAANELFEVRSANYSSRPQFKVLNDLMGWDWLISSMPYGDAWRDRRKLFNDYLHPSMTQNYQPAQVEFIRKMLVQLIDSPEAFRATLRHTIGGIAHTMAYALPLKAENDPYIIQAEEATGSILEATTPGAYMVEVVPPLRYLPKWFPGADFQRRLPYNISLQKEFRNKPFEDVVERMAAGTAKPCLVTTCLSQLDEGQDTAKETVVIKDTAAIVFAGGADTTVSGTSSFFLTMLHYPWVQTKAQEELDRVLGPPGTRLPDFNDAADLPYVTAVVKEILRWGPATPTGIAHLASEEDVYEGYRIPKGSMVFGNTWAMLRDEKEYPDPDTFNPERWLKDGKLNPDVQDPTVAAFGFGRRQCPGSHVAVDALWILAATVLATIRVSKPLDKNGNPFEQEIEYLTGLMCHPAPFKCTIKPRSKKAEVLIRSVAEE
ncbi:cytochrome P450 [Crepidotus variabilis]|uniref:Cytochrome P450 n=1 Tax=Crepidotus variabilis TaxID=179855 RepID=A0A9P6E680_9AGAR|nr:cytochrome P450 [Crepidotus variabilis]